MCNKIYHSMSQFHTKLTTHCPLHIILQKKELRIILLIRRIYNWMSALCMLKTLLCNGLDFELWIFLQSYTTVIASCQRYNN